MTVTAGLLSFDDLGPDDGRSAPGPGPTVVLLHPSGFGPAVMRPFAEQLARTQRVVLPHRRGYEGSAELPLAGSLDEHHDDLTTILTALEVDRPVLVGVSAGATLGLDFVIRHPELVGGAVVHEPLLGPISGPLHDVVTERIAELLLSADEPHHASLFLSGLVGRSEWNHLREDWRVTVDRNAAVVRREASLFASFAVTGGDLRALPATVAATVGQRSPSPRVEAQLVLHEHGVDTHTITDSRHLPVVENPTALAALVHGVLRRSTRGAIA